MARGLNKLSAKQVGKLLKQPGRYGDGGGLYLDVKAGKDGAPGSGVWTFLFRSPVHRTPGKGKQAYLMVGRIREMGFGLYGDGEGGTVTLAGARYKADLARSLITADKDPLDERKRGAEPVKAMPSFGEMADQLIRSMEAGWQNEKHSTQWRMTLTTYAAPLRALPVDQVATSDILECLKPHWAERPETADRLRGRIERVLNAAKAQGFRTGENPATWRGHLENLLPKRQKLTRGHHKAMPFVEVPAFMAKLRQREGVAALCLEWAILTAARSGEARGALWREIDTEAKVWTVSGYDPETGRRMKSGNEHRVPLTPRMLQILDFVKLLRRDDDLVFPGTKDGSALSDMTLTAALRRMKVKNATVHGFRSSFKDWATETTSFSNELSEAALAHVTGDATERAYRRGDVLDRRRELMAAWEKFCTGGSVIDLAVRRAG